VNVVVSIDRPAGESIAAPQIDRTSTNAWEDAEFLAALRRTGRRTLLLSALWTDPLERMEHMGGAGR